VKSNRCTTTGCRLGGSRLGSEYRPSPPSVATGKRCDVYHRTYTLRRRVVAEVDAVVERYQESIGISAVSVSMNRDSNQHMRCDLQLPDDTGPLTPVSKGLTSG
jgi:hypothetical protein